MAQYRVLDMHIRHGVGKEVREYKPGDLIDLTPEEAKRIGSNVAAVVKEKEKEKEKTKAGGKE